jgi:hypothetical protein
MRNDNRWRALARFSHVRHVIQRIVEPGWIRV